MIKKLGLRKESYFFDWLSNFDTGMSVVVDMIKTDFKKIIPVDAYLKIKHDSYADEVVVYKDYPDVLLVHTHPFLNKQEHEKLVRRANRFMAALKNPDIFINFIYQRTYETLKLSSNNSGISEAFDEFKIEGDEFVACLKEKYPNKNYRLVMVLQVEPSLYDEVVAKINFNDFDDDNVKYYCTVKVRSEFSQNTDLDKQWRKIIFGKCQVSWITYLIANLKYGSIILVKKIIYFLFHRDIPWRRPWTKV